MVPEAVDLRAAKVARAVDQDVVAVDADSRTEPAQPTDDSADAVGFLVAQLARAADYAAAARLRGREAQHRDLVDRGSSVRRLELNRGQLAGSHREVGDRFIVGLRVDGR